MPGMGHPIRGVLLPEAQRRTLDELTADLDLREGDRRANYSAFWTMLTLSAVIASTGILRDSTATVIGAMIIAPLSTPIMGTALALAKRERSRSLLFVVGGMVLVIAIGLLFSRVVLSGTQLLDNPQIAGRTSPSILDMVAALATGLAGAIALARRDVAAVLPGVAIAISLVPPLAVVGICLGEGEQSLAFGALLLFLSNLLALVLAGTAVYAVLGYAQEATERREGSRRRTYLVLTGLILVVSLPLVANTAATYALTYWAGEAEEAAEEWVSEVPGAVVTGSEYNGLELTINIESPSDLPPTYLLLEELDARVPDVLGVTLHTLTGESQRIRLADAGQAR